MLPFWIIPVSNAEDNLMTWEQKLPYFGQNNVFPCSGSLGYVCVQYLNISFAVLVPSFGIIFQF